MPDPVEMQALPAPEYLPHIDLLLHSLRINRERLNSRSKIAIDTRLLRGLLQALAASLPFSEEFYLASYADIAEAHSVGKVPDLHLHFIEAGFFEGRFGAPPPVDEAFYTATYRDVGQAVLRGDIPSGAEHYLRTGAAEGRLPNEDLRSAVDNWMSMLRDEAGRS
jgi:hypothetical protein